MTKLITSLALIAFMAANLSPANSFTASPIGRSQHHFTSVHDPSRTALDVGTTENISNIYYANLVSGGSKSQNQDKQNATPEASLVAATGADTGAVKKPANKPAKKPAAKKAAPHGKEGVLSPVVILAKNVLGNDEQFNKIRAKAISMHGDVIEWFVSTSETPAGRAILKSLYGIVDRNRNGSIEAEELALAFETLGFDWLKEKQVNGILARADKDNNGVLSLDEFMAEAPKTLRTNLIKLAKKNGGELGLLV